MVFTNGDVIRAIEIDEKLLTFDVSDEALERAAPIIGGVASVETEFCHGHPRQLWLPGLANNRSNPANFV